MLTIEKLANEIEVGQKYRHLQWVTSIFVGKQETQHTQSIGSVYCM